MTCHEESMTKGCLGKKRHRFRVLWGSRCEDWCWINRTGNLTIPTGWWYTYPSERYESQLGWLFPIYEKKMIQTTKQPRITDGFSAASRLTSVQSTEKGIDQRSGTFGKWRSDMDGGCQPSVAHTKWLVLTYFNMLYHLVMTNIAIKNGPVEIVVVFPLKTGDFP